MRPHERPDGRPAATPSPRGLGATRMTRVKLSSKYQVVIPEEVRRELDLMPGRLFEVFAFGGALRIVPVRRLDEAFGLIGAVTGAGQMLGNGAGAAEFGDPRDHEERP